eukprot:CAMPEP_0196654078 /NCGR_PEP_ID=MMETSP1086-20130531/3749_1 /TAXON_ID=77921 /ORGANISM="Cyanoptyche  gloeocystis , Strain SAG4.97" /LENGTH=271 /DNA_ID=CAMNT_0041985617 /DNA_START=71 /DNA_END=886 /DNA_ORIENTATION=-
MGLLGEWAFHASSFISLAAVITLAVLTNTDFFPKAFIKAHDEYQLLITPWGPTFLAWGLVYALELTYLINALLPSNKKNVFVQEAVSWSFVVANLFQCAFYVSWSYEYLWAAAASILLAWTAVLVIIVRLYSPSALKLPRSASDYWLIYVPFQMYFSWLSFSVVLYVCISLYGNFDVRGLDNSVLICGLIEIGLAAFFVVVVSLTGEPLPGLVYVWALAGIAIANPPLASISVAIGAVLACLVLLFAGIRLYKLARAPSHHEESDKKRLLV